MKRFPYILALLLGLALAGCKDKDNNPNGTVSASTQTELLVANKWKLSKFSDANGKTINASQIGVFGVVLTTVDIQFLTSNIARAIDPSTQQIINAGSWTLTADNKTMDINVSQLKGPFDIIELSRQKLTLRYAKVPVNGVDTSANLEFVPSL